MAKGEFNMAEVIQEELTKVEDGLEISYLQELKKVQDELEELYIKELIWCRVQEDELKGECKHILSVSACRYDKGSLPFKIKSSYRY